MFRYKFDFCSQYLTRTEKVQVEDTRKRRKDRGQSQGHHQLQDQVRLVDDEEVDVNVEIIDG